MEIHFLRLLLAAVGAFVAYMAAGFALFAAMPGLKAEFKKHPQVFRAEPEMMKRMPLAMLAIFVAVTAAAVIYALTFRGYPGLWWGLHFGLLIGVFAVCVHVIHDHVNLNISLKLTLQSGAAYFVQWLVVGIVLGVIYKPLD